MGTEVKSGLENIFSKEFSLEDEACRYSYTMLNLKDKNGNSIEQSFFYGLGANYTVSKCLDISTGKIYYSVLCKITAKANVPPIGEDSAFVGAYPIKIETAVEPNLASGTQYKNKSYSPKTLNGEVSLDYQVIAEKGSAFTKEHSSTSGSEVNISGGVSSDGPSFNIGGSYSSSSTQGGSATENKSFQNWDSASFSVTDWEAFAKNSEDNLSDQHWVWAQKYPLDGNKDFTKYLSWSKDDQSRLFDKNGKVCRPSNLSENGVEFTSMVYWDVYPENLEDLEFNLKIRCHYALVYEKGVNARLPDEGVVVQCFEQDYNHKVPLKTTALQLLERGETYHVLFENGKVTFEDEKDNFLSVVTKGFDWTEGTNFESWNDSTIEIKFKNQYESCKLLLDIVHNSEAVFETSINGESLENDDAQEEDSMQTKFTLPAEKLKYGVNVILIKSKGMFNVSDIFINLDEI